MKQSSSGIPKARDSAGNDGDDNYMIQPYAVVHYTNSIDSESHEIPDTSSPTGKDPSSIDVRDRRERLGSVSVSFSCWSLGTHGVGLGAHLGMEIDRCKFKNRRLHLTHEVMNMSLFDMKGIEKLGTLRLNGDIADVSEEAFNLTSHLTSLSIVKSCIACVKKTWFKGLDLLTDLDLSQNRISNIEDVIKPYDQLDAVRENERVAKSL
ncbi:Hypp3094 [Branchiostoma lanceolatum]|uniref:Hypp3094 protein n=1 Tax=Branchiostoma lanceolatum TaxID=7740 RepID=A0A8K0A1G7_BRALA|nr:Hypp3094 [Branchiostoma lanceolatum]